MKWKYSAELTYTAVEDGLLCQDLVVQGVRFHHLACNSLQIISCKSRMISIMKQQLLIFVSQNDLSLQFCCFSLKGKLSYIVIATVAGGGGGRRKKKRQVCL